MLRSEASLSEHFSVRRNIARVENGFLLISAFAVSYSDLDPIRQTSSSRAGSSNLFSYLRFNFRSKLFWGPARNCGGECPTLCLLPKSPLLNGMIYARSRVREFGGKSTNEKSRPSLRSISNVLERVKIVSVAIHFSVSCMYRKLYRKPVSLGFSPPKLFPRLIITYGERLQW